MMARLLLLPLLLLLVAIPSAEPFSCARGREVNSKRSIIQPLLRLSSRSNENELPASTRQAASVVDDASDVASSSAPRSQLPAFVSPRREVLFRQGPAAALLTLAATAASVWTASPPPASARLEAVNRPELLPKGEYTNVIQTEKVLTSGQAKRMNDILTALERDTGYRVRVLCQRYPVTPGLAIRDYWSLGKDDQKDDKYVVLVVDDFGGKGNVLNFNVGDGVKLALPNVFWTRLQAKYGTTFFVKDNGVDLAAINAIEAIATCLRSEDQFCSSVPDVAPSMRVLGL
jgi:TPM domain